MNHISVLSPVISSGSPGWRGPAPNTLPSPTGVSPNGPRIGQLENASIIAIDQLKLEKKIGGGEFGDVFKGLCLCRILNWNRIISSVSENI